MSVKIGSAEDLNAEHAFMDDDHMDAVLRAFKNSEKPEKFYSDDQPRDDHGRWSPGGGGGVGVGGAARERARVAQHKKDLVTGLRKWQDLVDMGSDINVHNTPEIAKIRGAASEIASGGNPSGKHADYARAMLAHAEKQGKPLIRGTASGYWEPFTAPSEKVLSHFPVGETMNLNMLSFTPDDTKGEHKARDFARYATERKSGSNVFLRLKAGANAIDTTKHAEDIYGKATPTNKYPTGLNAALSEREHIVADKAKITAAYKRGDDYYVHLEPLK